VTLLVRQRKAKKSQTDYSAERALRHARRPPIRELSIIGLHSSRLLKRTAQARSDRRCSVGIGSKNAAVLGRILNTIAISPMSTVKVDPLLIVDDSVTWPARRMRANGGKFRHSSL
jgi:hypothetical protein